MKTFIVLLSLLFMISCSQPAAETKPEVNSNPMKGTWKLLSGTLIEKGDTTVTDYSKNVSFIKILNDTHFAFLLHDLNKGADSTKAFSAGGGTYSLADSTYTEHLEYCSDRNWEGHDFPFTITIQQDTLVQRGVEKIESAGIDRINIEKYVRLK